MKKKPVKPMRLLVQDMFLFILRREVFKKQIKECILKHYRITELKRGAKVRVAHLNDVISEDLRLIGSWYNKRTIQTCAYELGARVVNNGSILKLQGIEPV